MKAARFASVMVAVIFSCSALFGQSGDFTTKGRVINASGAPIPNATITYVSLGKRLSWDYSDANGYFGGKTTGAFRQRAPDPRFEVAASGPVTIDFFDIMGKKAGSLHYDNMAKGTYSIEPIASRLSKAVYVLKVRSGASVQCLKLLSGGSRSAALNGEALSPSNDAAPIAKTAAAISDSIRVGKTGYLAVKKPIASYTADVGDVTLTTVDIEGQVNTLFGQMSQAEKVGQITQVIFPGPTVARDSKLGTVFGGGTDGPGTGTGSGTAAQWATFSDSYQNAVLATPHKIPLLVCLDVVHGCGKTYGATILPHNIGLGCTFDPRIVEKAYRVCAIESRGAGITMAFGPCIAVPRNDRWGRVYEGFSETPDLTKVMAKAAVLGFQTWDLSHPLAVCACTKHFAGDGGTTNGVDRGLTVGDDATLRAIHLPGYAAAVEAQTGAVMASFSAWNGVRMNENKPLLTDWLKTNQGFVGFVNGDYDSHTPSQGVSSGENCMKAGLDVPMSSGNNAAAAQTLATLFNGMYSNGNGARIDDAVKRVLRVKYRMGLFTGYATANSQVSALVGSQAHRDIAREAVRKSLVCLKNPGGILPLPKTAKITIVGQHAQDMGLQCGGWTMSWQGSAGNLTPGTTIRQGFESIGGAANISYSATGSGITGDYAVVVIGEQPYAEMVGDRTDLTVPLGNLVTTAKASGKKVICILISGRPMDITGIINSCDVFIAGWLPGTEGGGIAEVLYGNYDFSGKLSISWPTNTAQEPINYGDANYAPRYPYDFGLKLDGSQLPKGIYTH
jgi:beta-glucosidase